MNSDHRKAAKSPVVYPNHMANPATDATNIFNSSSQAITARNLETLLTKLYHYYVCLYGKDIHVWYVNKEGKTQITYSEVWPHSGGTVVWYVFSNNDQATHQIDQEMDVG